MGPYEPGPQYEFPPIKVNLYGKFTVNLGVFVQEVHEQLTGQPAPGFIPEYVCELRKRLPELLPDADRPVTEKGVGWWSLDDPPLKTASEIRRLTTDYAFPFLETVKTRDGVIDLWKREGEHAGLPPRGPLSIATIHFHRGDVAEAERMIRDYVPAGFKNPGHREFVEKVAKSMGITVPQPF